MSKKLAINQKVEIALSREKSLREIAGKYGVHHSYIDEIYKESEELLNQYWQEKSDRRGRPAKQQDVQAEELISAEREKKELTKQLALRQMRIDWLELQLKWVGERAQEKKQKLNNLKKKKK